MVEGSISSDKSLGIGLALSAITLIGAAMMYGAPTQIGTAWGFALAVVTATLAVVAFQIFE